MSRINLKITFLVRHGSRILLEFLLFLPKLLRKGLLLSELILKRMRP